MADLIARITARALTLKPVRAFLLYSEHRGPMLADSITYRTLFSLFAGVLLGFSIAALALAGNPVAWDALIDSVNSAIPGLLATDGSDGLIDPSTITAPAGLTVATVLSIVGLVGASIGAIGSLRAALRNIGDRMFGDVFFVFVLLRNLLIAIVIGAIFVAAAVISILATAGIGLLSGLIGLSEDSVLAVIGTRATSVLIVFALDTVAIALLFRTLSGVTASARALWSGSLLGGVGLVVLQQLSGLFVGGAGSNPLLATFATLIALLIWINLSAQAILIAGAYIVTSVDEERDRVRARHGASTFIQRRVQRAEQAVTVATDELRLARVDEEKERAAAAERT